MSGSVAHTQFRVWLSRLERVLPGYCIEILQSAGHDDPSPTGVRVTRLELVRLMDKTGDPEQPKQDYE